MEDIDKNLSQSVFCIEKELGVCITEDYPLMKFFNQCEELQKYWEEQERHQKNKKMLMR